MDFDKTLESLDFETDGLVCDAKKMLWLSANLDRVLPAEVSLAELHPKGCQARGTKAYDLRLCTCWPGSNPIKLIDEGYDLTTVPFVAGLIRRYAVLCPAHVRYFREYLAFPMVCPGCGLYFESVDEVLLREQEI
ncbi:hypothetical protein SEA_TRACKER_53 [Gordonia phage Tracker]|nr:hypothetical protein SEA_TRACKER_53 [Gordonia phage Tracker]